MKLTKNTLAITTLSITSTLFLLACSESTEPASGAAPQSQADDHAGHDHSGHDHSGHDHGHDHDDSARATPDIYNDILGQITMLPVEGDASKELKIKHVQIPTFKTKEGKININSKGVAGMASMTMPFPVGQGVSLDGIAVGDKVKFSFQVNWGGAGPAWEVTKIEKMDPLTIIDYTNKIEDVLDQAEDAMNNLMDDHSGHDHDDHSGHDHDGP